MYCLMCFNATGILQKFQQDINIDMIKKFMFVLPQLDIWDTKEDLIFCNTCLEQVTTFYTVKKTSLENFCRLKHYKDMLKEANDCEFREIKIEISPNYKELLLTAFNNDPIHSIDAKTYKRSSSNNSDNKQNYKNLHIDKFTAKASKSSKITSKKRRYKCSFCLKKFLTSNNLQSHIRIHTGERPYECQTCQNTFVRKHHLDIHKRTHSGEKPFQCDDCDKAFVHRGNLTAHRKRRHSEDRPRPFRCSVCSKTFTEAGNLNKHVKIHWEEKPFHCDLCSFKCVAGGSLRVHMRVHTGEKPYKCGYCERSCSRLHHLKTHEKTHFKKKKQTKKRSKTT